MSAGSLSLPAPLEAPVTNVLAHIRDGRFQRSLSLLVAGTSVVSGLEVGYEHYKGSFSNPIMYSPVLLSAALGVAAGAAFVNRRAARGWMRWVSLITLADGLVGLAMHVRGIQRKPGGWRFPVTNILMGPPLMAPLLFGTSAYLGLMASYLRREEDPHLDLLPDERPRYRWQRDLRHGRFQRHLAVVTVIWTVCSGFEALYSHYKSRFRESAQWIPLVVAPFLIGAALGAIKSKRIARTLLPVAAALTLASGVIGTGYHMRGIARRSGGLSKPLYNVLYGPPIFAPMLFAACGLLGLLASLLRREKSAA